MVRAATSGVVTPPILKRKQIAMNETALMQKAHLIIGTRGSPLALAQAHELTGRLAAALGLPPSAFPHDVIKTTGDAIQDRALSESGGKGLFTKEIDAAQLDGRIDLAVHSAKDLPTALPDGLVIGGYLPREDARDALIAHGGTTLETMRKGAIIGSASLRRQAILRQLRPDFDIVLLRGNVGTRIDKVRRGDIDGTLLALAGLRRLGLAHEATSILPLDTFVPAVGQGAIAVVIRAGDQKAAAAMAQICCGQTGVALTAERAFLTVLDGSCRTPIGGHATVAGDTVRLNGLLLSPDGSASVSGHREGKAADAAALGADLGRELRGRAPPGIYA
jgi:hydroxymethylbilane synthase